MYADTRRDGFTLIELMIVVVIIGILAAIAIPKFSSVTQKAKDVEAKNLLKQIYMLERAYQDENGLYTTDTDAIGYAQDGDPKYWAISITTTGMAFTATATETVDTNADGDTGDTWTVTNASPVPAFSDGT